MDRNELKEYESQLVWKCFEENIPELLRMVDDDRIAKDVIFSSGEYEGGEIWVLEREGSAIYIESSSEGVLKITLSEFCHKTVEINLIDASSFYELDELKLINSVSMICRTFVVGSWHVLMDYISEASDWKVALEAYLAFEYEHPQIATSITYIGV